MLGERGAFLAEEWSAEEWSEIGTAVIRGRRTGAEIEVGVGGGLGGNMPRADCCA